MSNPLLSKTKLPGRMFQLPSKGLFYKSGTLAEHVKNGEIQVQPLSALAELKLRSPDLLFSGRALREICLECIPDILKPEALVSKDVDAIFCFLRIVTYGSDMIVRSVHDCPNSKPHEYHVNVEGIILNPNNDILDQRDVLYSMNLSNGQSLMLRPITFQDAIDMTHLQQNIEKKIKETGIPDQKIVENAVIRDMMSVIESVDGISDAAQIEEWVRSLQKKFFTEIIKHSQEASGWGFNLTTTLKCKDCGDEYLHNLELDPINFFSG